MLILIKFRNSPYLLFMLLLGFLWFPMAAHAISQYQTEAGALYSNAEDDADFEATLLLGAVQHFFGR